MGREIAFVLLHAVGHKMQLPAIGVNNHTVVRLLVAEEAAAVPLIDCPGLRIPGALSVHHMTIKPLINQFTIYIDVRCSPGSQKGTDLGHNWRSLLGIAVQIDKVCHTPFTKSRASFDN